MGFGLWRRMKCVQWIADFTGKKQDTTLKETLLCEEANGIRARAVRGSVQWSRRSLETPDNIILFTKQYRSENDLVGLWIDEKCDTGTNSTSPSQVLWSDFSDWLRDGGFRVDEWNRTRFGRSLTARGFDSIKNSSGLMCRVGITPRNREFGRNIESTDSSDS